MDRHLEQLARVAEATRHAVIITDRAGRLVWANESFTVITGYGVDECLGRTPGSLLVGPQTDPCTVARIAAAVRAGRGINVEIVNYSKTGVKYWIELKIEPLLDHHGEVDGFMAIESDITERVNRDRELRSVTRRFELATRAGRIGIYSYDCQSNALWWNDIAYEIFGQDPNHFQPTLDSWLALVHPDDRLLVTEAIDCNSGMAALKRVEYRILAADGTVRHIISRGGRPAEIGSGAFTGSILDISERIASEQRERQLQKLLRESAHQAGMAEIATGVLHNVGNVLNSLGIANSTVEQYRKTMHLERLEKAVGMLVTNRDSLSSYLTNDVRGKHLVDYLVGLTTQLTTNDQELRGELETVGKLIGHLRDIVSAQQSVASMGGLSEATDLRDLARSALLIQGSSTVGIMIEEQYEAIPPVVSDPHKLMQIMVNFMRNAVDAMIGSEIKTCRIILRLTRDSDHAVFSVTDSGIGMSREVIANLWQFGYTTKPTGHGFGLHNSANAAISIDAQLSATSEGPGKGSCFTLRVPFHRIPDLIGGVAA